MSDPDPVMHLRSEVEAMLIAEGFVVLDIVTYDMDPEDGWTEWITRHADLPGIRRLVMDNSFGGALVKASKQARGWIAEEIERLKRYPLNRAPKRALDVPD